jgi:hypothetical protein
MKHDINKNKLTPHVNNPNMNGVAFICFVRIVSVVLLSFSFAITSINEAAKIVFLYQYPKKFSLLVPP